MELKTTAEIRSDRDLDNFERKLMKFWIQSFLLGVPRIVVGFRSRDGVLVKIQELETSAIPHTVQQRGRAGWDGNACINFASVFLECKCGFAPLGKVFLVPDVLTGALLHLSRDAW